MIRLAMIDEKGQIVAPKDVPTAMELLQLVEQARNVIRDCESLERERRRKTPATGTGQAPYLS